jgi:protein arginine kinase activator
MKCQRCPKPACYHITDVLGPEQVKELHLCEDCAKKHLYEPTPAPKKPNKAAVVPDDDLAGLGGKHCSECGTKFVEFRNTGRLGCPHDYDAFREELLPLLENIHGDVKHAGKSPRRLPAAKAVQQELAQLRRRLQQAVTEEAYEEAARLRDQIKQLEEG